MNKPFFTVVIRSYNRQLLLNCICYLLPVIVFSCIWLPLINHYHVRSIGIKDEIIDACRRMPADSVFNELKTFSFALELASNDDSQLVVIAEKILQGKVEIPGRPSIAIGMPFDADDLDKRIPTWPAWRLFFAGFAIPDVLLRAYQVTGRDDFLMAARDIILAWATYQRDAWLPKGFLWNDHAIAARILVLANFWKLYRNHPDYEPEVAKNLFEMVARSGQLLAKPEHFTFSTNHGIMQNLALWHICLAFPTLPNVEFYKQLAFERMRDQMIFYINDEGVVLEHSAGYQRAGLQFIGMAFRYLTLMNIPIPAEWRVKYQKAQDFYAQLRRPDGTLPTFGDTGSVRGSLGPVVTNVDANGRSEILKYQKNWLPKQSNSLYPVAGYSIWWDGLEEWPIEDKLSQTVVAWSYFPGHSHKHADEMSVLLWAGGQKWWTNVGYWPYGTKGRSEAVSWAGSNAPHLVNEVSNSVRSTKLNYYGWSDYLTMIDLERRGPQEYVARRQVVQLKPNLWIVIDHAFGNENDQNIITWTTCHNIQLRQGKIPGSYILKTQKNSPSLTKFILGSEGTKIMQLRGSFSPFAGWVENRPASAIVIEQPADNSWAVAIWSLRDGIGPALQFSEPPSMENWQGPENWNLLLPFASGVMKICREHNRVFVNEDTRGGDGPKEIVLSEGLQITNELADIHNGYENAARKYPRKTYSMQRQRKATYLCLFIFLFQEAFFLTYTRFGRTYHTVLRGLNSFGWIAMGIWLITIYL